MWLIIFPASPKLLTIFSSLSLQFTHHFSSLHSPLRHKANATYFRILLWASISVSISNYWTIYHLKTYQLQTTKVCCFAWVSRLTRQFCRSQPDLTVLYWISSCIYYQLTGWPRALFQGSWLSYAPLQQGILACSHGRVRAPRNQGSPDLWRSRLKRGTSSFQPLSVGQRKSQGQPILKSWGEEIPPMMRLQTYTAKCIDTERGGKLGTYFIINLPQALTEVSPGIVGGNKVRVLHAKGASR